MEYCDTVSREREWAVAIYYRWLIVLFLLSAVFRSKDPGKGRKREGTRTVKGGQTGLAQ